MKDLCLQYNSFLVNKEFNIKRSYFEKGISYERQMNYEFAIHMYKKVLSIDKFHLEAKERLYHIYNNINKVDKAEEIIDELLRYNGNDYIGILNIDNYLLPIKSQCKSLDINCKSDDSNFIIKGNNFKSSFIMYKEMNDLSKVTFTNMLGQVFTYKIDSVKRVKNVKNINYDGDLILIVKNYYSFEYIIYICNGI